MNVTTIRKMQNQRPAEPLREALHEALHEAEVKRDERWPNNLPPPIYGDDNRNLALSKSALRGFVMRDGDPHVDLTTDQARDIARWIGS